MDYEIDPRYDPLSRLGKWDGFTADIIKERLSREIGEVMDFDFLTEKEGEILEILTDVLIPQEKNSGYVKIAEVIDKNLSDRKEGVRYGENPWSGEFYKKGLAAVAAEAEKIYGKPVENMNLRQLEEFVAAVMEDEGGGLLPRFLRRVLADAISIYFSHPTAFSRIGFPGPAYPEGYARLDCGKKAGWEPEYRQKP